MRTYVANFEYSYYGKSQEVEFSSNHRANSKANFEDAMHEIKRKYERGISSSAIITSTKLAD